MRLDRWLFALAFALFLSGLARDQFDTWIDATTLPPLATETAREVRDRDGQLLRAYTVADGRWRLAVSPGEVDARYLRMLIAYEDKRFYDHAGIDPRAVLRAVVAGLSRGRITSGASTLTMQVARLLEEGSTGELRGKLRQARVALALERRLDKTEILALYLNRAPFGGNIEGLRAATLTWFGKEPRRLTPAESALLVALPQSPETRRPDRHAPAARTARDRVLSRMQAAGVIDADTATAATRDPVPTRRRPFPALAPHLSDRLIAADPAAQRHDTTLHRATQIAFERLARAALAGRGDRLSIAIVAADHTTGEVLAHVGSADYDNDKRQGFVDMTRALRSPGSTLKPLVYGLAFDQGLAHPDTLIQDVPMRFGTYAPQNFDGLFRGTVRMRDALQLSLNLPVVQLTEALGPARLMGALRSAGVEAVVPGGRAGLAVSLGGVGVSLEGLVQLFAGLAQGGVRIDVSALPQPQTRPRFLSPEAAWHVGHILSGIRPPDGGSEGAIAWKTGTSYGYRDVWAIGWDGRHVIGVWMGRADGTPVPGAFGAAVAAPVLFQAFQRIAPRRTPLPAPPPGTLMSGTANLPAPLMQFRSRQAALSPVQDAPQIAFPPDGARMALGNGPLVVKLRKGKPPFTILADGAPLALAASEREIRLAAPGPGFVILSVIDADGNSARAAIRLE